MKYYDLEVLDEKQIKKLSNPKMAHNEYICETAGFIPLEVKFKRFEQAGIRAQLRGEDFTSSDYREMYLNPDYQIYPDDEIEEIEEKFNKLRVHIEEVQNEAHIRVAKSRGEYVEKGGTEDPQNSPKNKNAADAASSESN